MDIDYVLPPEVFRTRTLTPREMSRYALFAQCVGTRSWWRQLLEDGCVIAGGAALFVVQRAQCLATLGDVDICVPGDCGERFGVYVCELVDWLRRRGIEFGVRVHNSIVTVWNAHLTVQFIKICAGTIADRLVHADTDYVQCALHFCDATPSAGKQLHVTMSDACAQAHETGVVRFKNASHWLFQTTPDRVRIKRDALRAKKLAKKGFEQISEDCNPAAGQPNWHVCGREHRPVASRESLDFAAMHGPGRTYRNVALSEEVVEQINQMCARPTFSKYANVTTDASTKIGCIDTDCIDDAQNQPEKQEWVELPCLPSVSRIDRDTQNDILRDIDVYERALKNQLLSPNKQLRLESGLRNLKLLMDSSVPLAEVQASVWSDRLKCTQSYNRSAVSFALGVQMTVTTNRAPLGKELYMTIRREFMD